ncbi:hypothetical protein JCGZ_06741 [Jatropha curcas]|uniref:Uncharacterized protein n=1 Tax=Jatropha curcas TaxID=180498 RepID=A0A067KMG0_JATCU|nr:hypothetical protein JCGZ_06741 [Jatropha curcas]
MVVKKSQLLRIEYSSHHQGQISPKNPYLVSIGRDRPLIGWNGLNLPLTPTENKRHEKETTPSIRQMLEPFGCVEVIEDELRRCCVDRQREIAARRFGAPPKMKTERERSYRVMVVLTMRRRWIDWLRWPKTREEERECRCMPLDRRRKERKEEKRNC